jgi:putative colanic acid biosynthesis acetyltransferase WcaF
MVVTIDTAANRRQSKYSSAEVTRRVLWGLAKPLFRFSPRVFFAWRNLLLRLFGARVGKQVHIYNTAQVYFPWNLDIGDWSAIGEQALIYNLGPVRIGSHVTISQRAHLCAGTHDHTESTLPLIKAPIDIEGQAWICADAFIGPGVTVGEGAVVGARAVAVKDVAPWLIVVGNPARPVRQRQIGRKPDEATC